MADLIHSNSYLNQLKKFQAKNNALSKLAKSELNFDSGATTPTSTVGARSDGGDISRPNSVQPISSVLEEDRRYEPRNDTYERKFVSPGKIILLSVSLMYWIIIY